jgi:hypothetical protein
MRVTAYLLQNEPASCCLLQVKPVMGVAKAKASTKCAMVANNRPETEWSTLGQDEVLVRRNGGPNAFTLKSDAMNWGEE